MNSKQASYQPVTAYGARIDKKGEEWTLVLVRDLKHPPEKVWRAITEPEHLKEWAPFDADVSLATVGAKAKLTTIGAPPAYATTETTVKRAEKNKALEYTWGGGDMRWELESHGAGTRLTLWAIINKGFIATGAAGWHVCFDVLDRLLADDPMGRLIAGDALQHEGWHRLHAEYAQQFGVAMPKMR
ncbi:MAG: SRPBCC family protein [Archangium sp.]|nr:SRPBCC family protein [Archangium sp.]